MRHHIFGVRSIAVLLVILTVVSSLAACTSTVNNANAEVIAVATAPTETQPEPEATEIPKTSEVTEVPEATEEITLPAEPEQTLDEFLDSLTDSSTRDFYKRLYDLYDFDEFNNRTEVPQYFQTLYTLPFSVGTIRSAGCGISSLAMIYSYLSDEEVTPDMMVKYDRGPNPASAMEAGIRSLKLNCETYNGWGNFKDVIWEAVDEGHPLILRMGPSSLFTKNGHFVVLAGKTEDGKYIINDPNLENLYKPSMVDGFMNGFTKEEVMQGLRGIYVFDTKDEYQANLTEVAEVTE